MKMNGAGGRNRTLVGCLQDSSSATELHRRVVAGVGIAPTPPAYETGVLLLDHPALEGRNDWLREEELHHHFRHIRPASCCWTIPQCGGDGGGRTLVVALQERCSSVELHPREWWNEEDSNLHLWCFRPALRPLQLSFHGVGRGNRTLASRITLSRSATELRPP
jgi:hypothetical protein